MSTYLYDEALTEKLRKWTKGTQVTLTSPEETQRIFEVIADKTNDRPIKFPMICIRRVGGFTVLNTGKKPSSFDGIRLKSVDEKTTFLNTIPISIQYQIDVYARYYREADEYARNLVFNIINYPKLEVEIPYENADRVHVSNIRMSSDTVSDNSSSQERLSFGQFTKLSIQINIDDAYLFDVRTKDNISIGFEIGIDGGDPNYVTKKDEIVYEYNINPDTDSFPE